MKKTYLFFVTSLFMVVVLALATSVYAQTTDDLVPTDVIDSSAGTSSWTEAGALHVLPGGGEDPWQHEADVLNTVYGPLFDITSDRVISFSFSIGIYDDEGNQIAHPVNSPALDILVMNATDDAELMRLRIWTDAGGALNGDHAYELYPIGGDWNTKYSGATWIKGNATMDSQFDIQFSKDNLFESYVGGSETLTRLDNAQNDFLTHANRLDDVDQVYFRLIGDGGFQADVDIVVKAINGQSLANSEGVFVDTVAPVVLADELDEVMVGEPLELPATAHDLMGPVTYRIEDEEENVLVADQKVLTPDVIGPMTVVLVATDEAGNETHTSFSFDVIEAFSLNAWDIVDSWDSDPMWTEEGAMLTLPGGVPDAWNRRAEVLNNDRFGPLFNLGNDRTISFAFGIGLYDASGNEIAKSNNSSALDIHVMNAENDQEVMLLRIWVDSGGATNGSHSYEIYPISGDWGTVIYGSTWIQGDAKIDDGFFIQFSKERLFESFVGGSEDITRLDNANEDVLAYTDHLDDIDDVYFRISGDNGFTADVDLIVTEINGQSLSNTEGAFTDTVSPILIFDTMNQTITYDEPFTIPAIGYDLLSDVTYRLEDNESNTINENGLTFTPTELGEMTVVVVATDASGNETRRTLNFNVITEISAPELTDVPVIGDIEAPYYEYLSLPAPTVIEESGNYDLVLHIYDPTDLETPLFVLTPDDEDLFHIFVTDELASGDYVFKYLATNVGGTTTSEPETMMLSIDQVYDDTFATPNEAFAKADYIDDGLRVRSTGYARFDLGIFDVTQGVNIKFQIPESSTNVPNTGWNGYAELMISDPDDPQTYIALRVWLDVFGAPDNPTNVFIGYPEQDPIDISNAGWILNTVDGLDRHFHMAFNAEDYFLAERLGGIASADNAASALETFMETVDRDDLLVSFIIHSHFATGSRQYYEAILTEVAEQPLQSTDGVIDDILDATLELTDYAPEKVRIDSDIVLPVYFFDLFDPTSGYSVDLTGPDAIEASYTDLKGTFSYTPTVMGTYTFIVSAVGTNGQEVTLDPIEVEVKDKVTTPTVSLSDNYASTYDQGDTIDIIEPTYSQDVVLSEALIEVRLPDGTTESVTATDDFTFTMTGIYTILYTAKDDAQPTPNVVEVSYSINVPDTTDPVVTIPGLNTEGTLDSTFDIPEIIIEDDSTYSVVVMIENPDGDRETIGDDVLNNRFTPNMAGEWKLIVRVTDLYDNTTTNEYTITILEDFTGTGCCESSASTSMVRGVFTLVILLAGFFVLVTKKK
jgi:hypothetical protein